jgi:hypothetical protein
VIPYKVRLEGNKKWIEAHSYTELFENSIHVHFEAIIGKNGVEIDIPCRHLCDGKCLIYDKRFPACKEHPVGGDMCINAIKKMRPEREKEILEAMKDE